MMMVKKPLWWIHKLSIGYQLLSWYSSSTVPYLTIPQPKTNQPTTSWWFPPIWKICSSNWKSSPRFGVKIKHIWNHHLEKPPAGLAISQGGDRYCSHRRASSYPHVVAWKKKDTGEPKKGKYSYSIRCFSRDKLWNFKGVQYLLTSSVKQRKKLVCLMSDQNPISQECCWCIQHQKKTDRKVKKPPSS